MNINSVNNANIFKANEVRSGREQQESSTSETSETSRKADSLEISSEAVKLGRIKQRIEEGFYNRHDVLQQVAYKINQDLK